MQCVNTVKLERDELPFWERPETVEKFADRDPDHRLAEIVTEFPDPGAIRVLDLGCAGGRNAVMLAERGFDLVALDGSAAMVAETRRRVALVLGEEEAAARVRVARMDSLEPVGDESTDLVVALGIYHQAERREEWDAALRETARVLRPGGRLLVAVHTDQGTLCRLALGALRAEEAYQQDWLSLRPIRLTLADGTRPSTGSGRPELVEGRRALELLDVVFPENRWTLPRAHSW